jgi:hypothetical protein
MVVHACKPALKRMRQEDQELENSLGYIMRPCLKDNPPKKVNILTDESETAL